MMTTDEVIRCLEAKIKYQEAVQERSARMIDRATAVVLRSRASVVGMKRDIARFKAELSEDTK